MRKSYLGLVAGLLMTVESVYAWVPSGWTYWAWPFVCDHASSDWYWFNTGDTQWVYAHPPGTGWKKLPMSTLASGWAWWTGSYAYDSESGAWLYRNESDRQWCVNMRTAQWSLFGSAPPDRQKWHLALNGGPVYYSSPAIGADGTIYVGSGAPFAGAPTRGLYAVNPDGTPKWQYVSADFPAMYSPCVGTNGSIYIQDSVSSLYAINPDGTLDWKYTLNKFSEVGQTAPAIANDGTLYIGADALYAIHPDGTLKWRFVTNDVGSIVFRCSPAVSSNGTIYVGVNGLFGDTPPLGCMLLALNADGTFRWQYVMPVDGIFSSPAIGGDGAVYFGTERSGETNWVYALNPEGTLRWRFEVLGGRTLRSSPAIGSDGTIYIGTKSGSTTKALLLAINPDGTRKWDYSLDVVGDDIYCSPAVGADGLIYFGAESRFLYALKPDGTLAWKYDTGNGINWTSPAIATNGTIYVGNNHGWLYAIRSESLGLADSPWPKFRCDNVNSGRK
jgi:outer membrane protein assembly factor BamB